MLPHRGSFKKLATEMTSLEAELKGPFFWENWRHARDGNPTQATYEFPLDTDGWVTSNQVNSDLDLGF